MKANRFYSIPYDARNDTKMLKLGKRQRGKMLAYGRWQALLAMLYDEDGVIDLSDETSRLIVRDELEFKSNDQMDKFMDDCAECGLIELFFWSSEQHVINKGVVDELEYHSNKKNAGGKGGRGNKKNSGSDGENETKTESN